MKKMLFAKHGITRLATFFLLGLLAIQAACTTDPDPREIETLVGHSAAVTSVRFSPDGRILASSGEDNKIKLWDTTFLPSIAGGMLCEIEDTIYEECLPLSQVIIEEMEQSPLPVGQVGDISSLDFSSDGKLLAAGTEQDGRGGVVLLFEVESGLLLSTLSGFRGPVGALAFSPDDNKLAVGAGDLFTPGEIVVWDIAEDEELHSLTGHHSAISSLDFSGDGGMLASSSSDGSIIIWDMKTGEAVHTLIDNEQGHPVHAVAFHPSGHLLAGAGYHTGRGGALTLWYIDGEEKLFKLGGPSLALRDVVFDHAGQNVIGASEDQKIWVWGLDLPSTDLLFDWDKLQSFDVLLRDTIKGHWGAVNSLDLSPNGSVLASGSDDTFVRLWAMADLTGDSCHDDSDDDGDGWTDEDDPDCLEGVAEVGYGSAECNDGLDNDDDGMNDADDPQCEIAGGDESSDQCHDGIDNDADGWFDGKDPDCRSGDEETGLSDETCNDGEDNDDDDYIDAGDPECINGWDEEN